MTEIIDAEDLNTIATTSWGKKLVQRAEKLNKEMKKSGKKIKNDIIERKRRKNSTKSKRKGK